LIAGAERYSELSWVGAAADAEEDSDLALDNLL